jgi:soluble lytic murein transglycosylase-like protein
MATQGVTWENLSSRLAWLAASPTELTGLVETANNSGFSTEGDDTFTSLLSAAFWSIFEDAVRTAAQAVVTPTRSAPAPADFGASTLETLALWASGPAAGSVPAVDHLIESRNRHVPTQPDSHSWNSEIEQAVDAAAAEYGVPAALIRAVIEQESGGNADAVSPAGALGLMQLMPDTARSLGISDPMDPVQNIFGGTRYLAQLLKQFGGRVDLALAAYNAGPGAVERWGGIPPYPETQAYVRSVLSRLNA